MLRSFGGEPRRPHYIKPLPLVMEPWASDASAALEAGVTGVFEVRTRSNRDEYAIFEQAGDGPASTDAMVARMLPPFKIDELPD